MDGWVIQMSLAGVSEEAWIDHEYHAAVDASVEPEPTLEEVRKALSSISGKLSDVVRTERDARG